MKAIMRPHKSQYKSIFIFTDTALATNWDRRPLMQVGFTDFDILLVGASGSRAGDAWGQTSGDRAYSSAGGGGGSLRLKGKLKDLTADVAEIRVGAKGINGPDSGSNEAPAGTGAIGEESYFLDGVVEYSAQGGGGGIGADFDFTTTRDFSRRGEGGDGGGNSAGLGGGGVGGLAIMTDPQGDIAGTAPTIGTYQAGGVYPVVGGAKGGGGGPGKVKIGGSLKGPAYAGADGNSGAPTWQTGPGGPPGTNDGGYGGGCSIGDFQPGVATPDIYGSGQGVAPNHDSGVVCIKVT